MSNITEWIKYELYPSLFEVIDTALPEHNFKRVHGNWWSKTYLDGTPHKNRNDKTVVTKKAPHLILEQGGEVLSLIDYIIQRDKIDFIDAVKLLANITGLEVPTDNNYSIEEHQTLKTKISIYETANKYFEECLHDITNPSAVKVKNYLLGERGYTSDEVNEMSLGFIPSQNELRTFLINKGYNESDIKEHLQLNSSIGETHQLSIPYRSGGQIKGFKFRTIGNHTPKYLNSSGSFRVEGFFNISSLKSSKDLIIVEGELDSLSASVKGLDNVVAIGGNNVSPEQVQDALKKGYKRFTICLDYVNGEDEETLKRINGIVNILLDEGIESIYIADLTDASKIKVDADSFIKDKGINEFKNLIDGALLYYEFHLQNILNKYGDFQESKGYLTSKEIEDFTDEVVVTALQINDAIHRDKYINRFISLEPVADLGITKDEIDRTISKLKSLKNKEEQNKEFKKLLSEVNQLSSKGNTDIAIELLESKVKEVKHKDSSSEFYKLLIPTNESQIKQEEANSPISLDTGFEIDGEQLLLPGGAISVYAAPTNHGKTIMLINSILNVAEKYPEKKFIFFTYEEKENSIIQYLLNTYVGIKLNNVNKNSSNRRLIRDYFRDGSTQYFTQSNVKEFLAKKETFFKELIESGRIIVKYIDYNSEELCSAIEFLNKEVDNIGGVFIDYFQLLKLPQGKFRNYSSRVEELKQICISLKDTAVTTGLPLVLAAQFNREVTSLTKLHPTNISEAGDIERIVNLLVGVWNMNKKPLIKGSSSSSEEDIIQQKLDRIGYSYQKSDSNEGMYLEILKSRDTPTGKYDVLEFNGYTGKVNNRQKLSF
ncbi:hypothetical protein OBK28_12090 [Empedobacter falsenii]